jgi:hypothetical protein
MASSNDVPIVPTDTGVKVSFGDLYMYPDGHANLTFKAVPQRHFASLNLPLTNAVDVMQELTNLVKRMQDEIVTKRPGQS